MVVGGKRRSEMVEPEGGKRGGGRDGGVFVELDRGVGDLDVEEAPRTFFFVRRVFRKKSDLFELEG
jgi:hypothetical protein